MLVQQRLGQCATPIRRRRLGELDELPLVRLMQASGDARIALALLNAPDKFRPFAILLNTMLAHDRGNRIDIRQTTATHRDHPACCGNAWLEVLDDRPELQLLVEHRQRDLIGHLPLHLR